MSDPLGVCTQINFQDICALFSYIVIFITIQLLLPFFLCNSSTYRRALLLRFTLSICNNTPIFVTTLFLPLYIKHLQTPPKTSCFVTLITIDLRGGETLFLLHFAFLLLSDFYYLCLLTANSMLLYGGTYLSLTMQSTLARINVTTHKEAQAYAKIRRLPVSVLLTLAIQEYIARHPVDE